MACKREADRIISAVLTAAAVWIRVDPSATLPALWEAEVSLIAFAEDDPAIEPYVWPILYEVRELIGRLDAA